MSPWLAGALLLLAGVLAHWGADRVVGPFQQLRARFGLSGAAGAVLIAMITASPEIGINSAAAVRGVGDIGLGNMLGANIVSVPLIVLIAWVAACSRRDMNPKQAMRLDRGAITAQALPYLGIVALVGVLTLPPAWRGLQPLDGWIMLAAFVAFLLQALLRHLGTREPQQWSARGLALAGLGVLAVAGGAWLAVVATESLSDSLGIRPVIAGLFLAATASVLPEAAKTWVLVRQGEATAGTSSVIADNAATMTLGFAPLAFVSVPVEQPGFYAFNLAFAGLFGLLFAGAAGLSRRDWAPSWAPVALVGPPYLLYVILVFAWFL
jgi:cation:H+ antiporter